MMWNHRRQTFDQGYFCCKRRVLEFEEFLKIEGCAEGRHIFVPKSNVRDASDTSRDYRLFADLASPFRSRQRKS